MQKQIKINNQIRSPQVRVIDEKGINIGILPIAEALRMAQEKETDLIEISPTTNPPVCKIMDYGKFLYLENKKTKKEKPVHQAAVREIRISLGISRHDLEVKAKKALAFLDEGDKVKIEMFLKGREKYLDKNFLEERLKRIFEFMAIGYKITEGPKRGPRGLMIMIEKI